MSEIPNPQPDPSDLSDDQKKELKGIEFSSTIDAVAKDRYTNLNAEMKRHGFNPNSLHHPNAGIRDDLRKVYEIVESDTMIQTLDGLNEIGELDIDLGSIGVELDNLVDIRFDFLHGPGVVFEQVVRDVGEQKDYLRWTIFFLNKGKLFVRSINSEIEEIGSTEDEHSEHIRSKLAESVETEQLLGGDELSSQDAYQVVEVVKELSGILGGFYASVALNHDDLGNWKQGPSSN